MGVASAFMIVATYSRCGPSSVSVAIVRNFSTVRGFMSFPRRTCLKKTGPGESLLIRQAIQANSGSVRISKMLAQTTSIRRFSVRETAGVARGGQRDHREPLDCVHPDGRPEGLEQPGDDIDLDLEVMERMHRVEERGMGVVRERDDDAVDVVPSDDVGHVFDAAQQRDPVEVRSHLARRRVDEPHQLDSELRVLPDLAPDQLPDISGAHDDRVLNIGRPPAHDRPGTGAGARDQTPARRSRTRERARATSRPSSRR